MSLIRPSFLDRVVVLGIPDSSGKNSIQFVATGFLYGHFAGLRESGKPEYYPYLVTNRSKPIIAERSHIPEAHPSRTGGRVPRPIQAPARRALCRRREVISWYMHTDIESGVTWAHLRPLPQYESAVAG